MRLELRDTLALQSKVAKAIADQIRINLNSQEQACAEKTQGLSIRKLTSPISKGATFSE